MDEDLPPRLQLLDDLLTALAVDSDAMMLSELDGFIAALVLCPDPIPPSEWLPLVWGAEEEAPAEGADERQAIIDLIMEHYDAVALELRRGALFYAPIYDTDDRNDEILWEIWASGFERAMTLRPASWMTIIEGEDEDAALAVSAMITLSNIANGMPEENEGGTPEQVDALTKAAPDFIPVCVLALRDWRWRGTGETGRSPVVRSDKVGRNEPCPCGSGKKYKKCCGLQ